MDIAKVKPSLNKNYVIIALVLVIVSLVVVFFGYRYIPGMAPLSSQPSDTSATGIGGANQPPGVVLNQQQAGSDTGKPVMNPLTGMQTGIQCPKDSCLGQVKGAGNCPNSAEAYYEQECYDYPDSASSLADCDKKRTVYYKICGVAQ